LTAQEIELKEKNKILDKILLEVRAENVKTEAEKAIGKILENKNNNAKITQ